MPISASPCPQDPLSEQQQGELSTLKNTSTGYNALLTEKLHLSRDLSNLRSENERLKSQNSAHQALVAEKHEMERQLNSLEVQLQNEKHAHERTRAKGSQQAEEVDKLYSRIDELQGELTRDLRAKQQHERDNRQQITGWDSQRAVLEGKIEMLKKQLRSTKDKLQETQHDLQQRRSNLKHHEADHAESRSRVIPLQRSGPSAEYHSGVTIATPGAVRVKEKAKRQSALPGDKSAFSITPFLNRTGAPRDSVSSSEEEENEMDLTMDDSHASLRKVRAVDELSEVDSVPKDGPGATRAPPPKFGKAKAREGKPSISRPVNGVQQPASRLDRKVSQDESEELRDPTIEQEQAKPKKRKLGAQRDRNLFEDEDEEELFESRKPGRKLALGAARNSVLATTTAPPATSTALNRTLGLGAPMGFSPLKRDRKRF